MEADVRVEVVLDATLVEVLPVRGARTVVELVMGGSVLPEPLPSPAIALRIPDALELRLRVHRREAPALTLHAFSHRREVHLVLGWIEGAIVERTSGRTPALLEFFDKNPLTSTSQGAPSTSESSVALSARDALLSGGRTEAYHRVVRRWSHNKPPTFGEHSLRLMSRQTSGSETPFLLSAQPHAETGFSHPV